jgi:hypothetical protein
LVWFICILTAIWLLVVPYYIYLFFSKQIKKFELTAVLLIAIGGTLMITVNTQVGAVVFFIGLMAQALIRVFSRSKN